MNKNKLQQAEREFLDRYPGGFLHPEMAAVGKKHKMEKMIDFAQANFEPPNFEQPSAVAEAMTKMVSRSSMVSLFEKPKFRDGVNSLADAERDKLCDGLGEWLHGNQQAGFEAMLAVLQAHKLGKWTLMTIIPNYYHPDTEVFVKPTTSKGVIAYFELDGLHYRPQPSWDFYRAYRDEVLSMKALVDDSLAPSNAAFSGFLMMTMGA